MLIYKTRKVKTPEYGTREAAGIDFFIPEDFGPIELLPQEDIIIPSGIIAKIPKGYMLIGADKSSIAPSISAMQKVNFPKKKIGDTPVIIGSKIIDSDYQGEIHFHLINLGKKAITLYPGMKITQFILVPVLHDYIHVVNTKSDLSFESDEVIRTGGFGSTSPTITK